MRERLLLFSFLPSGDVADDEVQLWHCADIDFTTMAVSCREMRISEIAVSNGRHILDNAAAREVQLFWDVMEQLRKDWMWSVRFFILRERDLPVAGFHVDIQNYIEMGERPEQHEFWHGQADIDWVLRPRRRRGAGGGGGRGRPRGPRGGPALEDRPAPDEADPDPIASEDDEVGGESGDDDPGEAGGAADGSQAESESGIDLGEFEREVESDHQGSYSTPQLLAPDSPALDLGGDAGMSAEADVRADLDLEPLIIADPRAAGAGDLPPLPPPLEPPPLAPDVGPGAMPADAIVEPPPAPHAAKRPRRAPIESLTAEVEGQKVHYYASNGNFMAECSGHGHGRCNLTRGSVKGTKPGSGQPLGLLVAWLVQPEVHLMQDRRRTDWERPTFEERVIARLALMGVPKMAQSWWGGEDREEGEPIEEPPYVH